MKWLAWIPVVAASIPSPVALLPPAGALSHFALAVPPALIRSQQLLPPMLSGSVFDRRRVPDWVAMSPQPGSGAAAATVYNAADDTQPESVLLLRD